MDKMVGRTKGSGMSHKSSINQSFPLFGYTGSPKTTTGCKEEEAGNIGEAH